MASDATTGGDSDLNVTRAHSVSSDPATAISEVWDQIQQTDPKAAVIFCSSRYDLAKLSTAIRKTFKCPVLGCTTAGEINQNGFAESSISAVGFGGDITVDIFDIDLDDYLHDVAMIADKVNRTLANAYDRHAFGFLLVDGLSLAEEHLTANLYQGIGHIPLVGGSAGDDLQFVRSHVYVKDEFRSGHAVFACFTTSRRILPIRFDHFRPTEHLLLVTESNPAQRIIHELNGESAAVAYAKSIGVSPDELGDFNFSTSPFVLEIGGHSYIRSLQSALPDGSLSLFSAIENGVVLSVGRGIDPVQAARKVFTDVKAQLGEVSVILGCDCVLRKQEYIFKDILGDMGKIMSEFNVVGFSTYGEQYNAVHINQTFSGIAIAA